MYTLQDARKEKELYNLKLFARMDARAKKIDDLIKALTGFTDFADLLNAKGGYRPSLNVTCKKYGKKFKFIADQYDNAMEAKGDDRRAFRF